MHIVETFDCLIARRDRETVKKCRYAFPKFHKKKNLSKKKVTCATRLQSHLINKNTIYIQYVEGAVSISERHPRSQRNNTCVCARRRPRRKSSRHFVTFEILISGASGEHTCAPPICTTTTMTTTATTTTTTTTRRWRSRRRKRHETNIVRTP